MRQTIMILLFGLLLIGMYVAIHHARIRHETGDTGVVTTHGAPTFTWSYQYMDQGEFPRTDVSIVATYPDGFSTTKLLGTVDGSCNEYVTPDKDIYERSTMSICYAAGLGHYFKVVKEGDTYTVQEKIFEEGGPEYTPPDRPYETVATF